MSSKFRAGKLFLAGGLVLLGVLAGSASAVSATSAYTCPDGHYGIDGSKASNLVTTWDGADTFTVQTKNGVRLCDDVTLYASSYILTSPDYKGGLFGAPGTYPQTLYKSVSVTLKKGTNGTITGVSSDTLPTTITVPLSPCGNQQVDLYYAPEVTSVGPNGHGSQYIAGNVITPFNDTVCTGGQGGGGTTPTPTPTQPQVQGASTTKPAATLTDTGLPVAVTSALGAGLMGGAILVARRKPATNFDDISL